MVHRDKVMHNQHYLSFQKYRINIKSLYISYQRERRREKEGREKGLPSCPEKAQKGQHSSQHKDFTSYCSLAICYHLAISFLSQNQIVQELIGHLVLFFLSSCSSPTEYICRLSLFRIWGHFMQKEMSGELPQVPQLRPYEGCHCVAHVSMCLLQNSSFSLRPSQSVIVVI